MQQRHFLLPAFVRAVADAANWLSERRGLSGSFVTGRCDGKVDACAMEGASTP